MTCTTGLILFAVIITAVNFILLAVIVIKLDDLRSSIFGYHKVITDLIDSVMNLESEMISGQIKLIDTVKNVCSGLEKAIECIKGGNQ